MSLANKIDEIRRKPEREKMKYVWGMVAVCMFFIIFVWIISLKGMMKNEKTDNGGGNIFNSLESISEDSKNQNTQDINGLQKGVNNGGQIKNYDNNQGDSTYPSGFSGE